MGHTLLCFFLLSLFLYQHLDFKAKMYWVTEYTVKLCWSGKPFLFEKGELNTTNRYICGSHGPNAEPTPQAPDRHQVSPGWAASKGFRRHSNTKLRITFFLIDFPLIYLFIVCFLLLSRMLEKLTKDEGIIHTKTNTYSI